MTKRTLDRVWSPQLRNRRPVDIYLPWSYPSGRRYPVVYMQDGQNLSDPSTAFAGTWDLEGALGRLALPAELVQVAGPVEVLDRRDPAGVGRGAQVAPLPQAVQGVVDLVLADGRPAAAAQIVGDVFRPQVDDEAPLADGEHLHHAPVERMMWRVEVRKWSGFVGHEMSSMRDRPDSCRKSADTGERKERVGWETART
jgi:hypothetical protein